MQLKRSGASPIAFARVPKSPKSSKSQAQARALAGLLAGLLVSGAVALGGCGSSSHSTSSSSPSSGSPVIVGSQANSLPAPPPQSNANRYAGIDVASGNGGSWNWRISRPDRSYNYQQQQGVLGAGSSSGGTFTSFGDFEYLADNTNAPYTFAGLDAEIDSGVAVFAEAFGGSPLPPLSVGVLQQGNGCLAPNGSVTINFLVVPYRTAVPPYNPSKDTIYGNTSLSYKDGVFSYSKVSELTVSGANASGFTFPFPDSYCIQGPAGYALQSVAAHGNNGTQTMLAYLGATGGFVGGINSSGGGGSVEGLVGMTEPKAPIDLSAVTAATYKGFYYSVSPSVSYPNPAYFGKKSRWIKPPVFAQTGTSLVGGNVDFNTFIFTNPASRIAASMIVDFGAQDSSHPGLFPSATVEEPDPSNLCKPSQQSTSLDGTTYCTFPVVALIGESYGKYAIFLSGPEPTVGAPLFYALVQD
jgi:hypothetical protein